MPDVKIFPKLKWVYICEKPVKIILYNLRYSIFIFLFISLVGKSQELPPVLNFDPNEYAAGNQNWMISKAENGNIYVANSMGLLEFNGSRWEVYSVPNKTIVRAVKAVGNKVFTGAYMEVGYWKRNACGSLEYVSLLSKFPEKIRDGEQFWRIEYVGDTVILQSFEGIYLYNLKDDSLSRLSIPEGSISNLFKTGKDIYFLMPDSGLFAVQNGAATLKIPVEKLKGNEIIYVYHVDKQLNLINRTGDVFLWSGEELLKQNPVPVEALESKSFFSALELKDGSLLLGSIEDGIFQISNNGNLIQHFNQENGLQNNTVLNLFLDDEDNVWAGLDNGISVVNFNSPFRLFQEHVGRIGTVYTSFQNEDFLYLGTNQGLYFRRNTESNFKLIPGTNGQVWSLQELDGTLFCGHNNGTFVVSEATAEMISERQGTWLVTAYKPLQGFYVQGHYNGFSLLQKTEEGFKDFPLIKDFPHSSKFIVEENGDIWIGNEHKGVFRLSLKDSGQDIESLKNYPFNEESGITSSIFKFNGNLYYSTISDIFQYDPETDTFSAENELSAAFNEVQRISGRMVNVGNKIFGFGTNAVVSAGLSNLERAYSTESLYLPRETRSIPLGYENISRLKDDDYLLGLVDGYLLVNDFSTGNNREYKLKIDRVIKAALDETPKAIALDKTPELNYKTNNVSFQFSIPEYKKYVVPLYSYRLQGLSSKWSEWSPDSGATFKNLTYGDYSFEVKGKVGDQIIPSATFNFLVLRPWYFSNLAIAGYILLFLLFLFIIHLVYNKEHQKKIKENEKALKMQNLEAEQKIIKLQNEQLEKEMAGKSRELAVSTMSLIKKNEFLNSIKLKLKESEDSSQIRSVIRTIDKDISEKDNWNFFKKAFSNADKDFFKKVKSRHPELTSNDLKLCAYLRLNLNSKEIAPLLNISVKSVEIKRYRLRKKMNLSHEINLVDYILEV